MADLPDNRDGVRECPKCGALLPADDEVLCQNCGTAFGPKTQVIKAVTPLEDAEGSGRRRRFRKWRETHIRAAGTSSPWMIMVIIGLVALVAALLLILLVLNS